MRSAYILCCKLLETDDPESHDDLKQRILAQCAQEDAYAIWSNTLGKRSRKKIDRNTYLERCGGGIALRLHQTNVVTVTSDGTIRVSYGAWQTRVTVDRINNALVSLKSNWKLYSLGRPIHTINWYNNATGEGTSADANGTIPFTNGDSILGQTLTHASTKVPRRARR